MPLFRNCDHNVLHDHNPPRAHGRYGGQRALVAVDTLTALKGRLSLRVLGLVAEWAPSGRRTRCGASRRWSRRWRTWSRPGPSRASGCTPLRGDGVEADLKRSELIRF